MIKRYNIVIINTKNGKCRNSTVFASSSYSARLNSEQTLASKYEKVACVYPNSFGGVA